MNDTNLLNNLDTTNSDQTNTGLNNINGNSTNSNLESSTVSSLQDDSNNNDLNKNSGSMTNDINFSASDSPNDNLNQYNIEETLPQSNTNDSGLNLSNNNYISSNFFSGSTSNPISTTPIEQNFYQDDYTTKDISNMGSNLPGDSKKSSFNLDNSFLDIIKNFILNFIFPLVNFIIIVALIVFLIIPINNNYQSNNEKLSNNNELVVQLQSKYTKIQDISYLQNVFTAYYGLVESALVSSQQVPELLTVIDNIAKNSGLSVQRLSYSISQSNEQDLDYSTVDVSLNVTGNLDQLITFFEQSENAIRIFNIDTFRFSYNQESRLFDVSFLIRSPYLEVNSVAVTDDPINLNLDDPEFTRFINRLSGMTYYNPNELVLIEPVETVQEEQVTEDESNNEEINQVEQTVEQQANVEQVVSTNPEQIVGQ